MNLLTNNNIENNLNNNELIKGEEQTSFIETTLGQTVNFGLDIGLRALLPDFIEEQIIDIKDTLLKSNTISLGIYLSISLSNFLLIFCTTHSSISSFISKINLLSSFW